MDQKPIGMLTISIISTVAILFDLLSLIPFLNIITNMLFLIMFGVFLFMNGISILEYREIMAIVMVGGVIGFVPFLSMLPENIGMTVATIIFTNKKRSGGGMIGGMAGKLPGMNSGTNGV